MNRLRIVVLVIWAGGLSILLIAGRYALFIRAELWPLLLGTVLMFALFLAAMIARRKLAVTRKASAAVWLRSGLLLLPLAYLFPMIADTSSASGLNSFALRKRALGLNAGTDMIPGSGAPAGDPGDVVSLGYIAKHRNKLDGHRVVTEGRVSRDDTLPAGQVILFRFVVVCCAADAMPVQAIVVSPSVASLQNDQWIRVDGTLRLVDKDGAPALYIDAKNVESIPPPEDPYLSPYRSW